MKYIGARENGFTAHGKAAWERCETPARVAWLEA
jgi:hypothetical protein